MALFNSAIVAICLYLATGSQVFKREAVDALQHLHADPKKPSKDDAAAKKGGKVEDLNKDMPLKAQEQGFTGKKVQHVDGKTNTSDWMKEYGHSSSFTQALRADPKKADAKAKKEESPKKGGKVQDLNKNMPLKAQEQGFTGKKVQHDDGKTGTADWQKEYGHGSSFGQALVRADPKKAAAKPKKDDAAAKKGGKVEDLNKDMPLKAQEQGFTGKKVQHVDGKTNTSDWMKEYGPHSFTQAGHVRADPKKAAAKSDKEAAAPKKGGKVQDLNKKMPLKAQEQGFTGKKVEHDDGKTGTADWQKEYGHGSSFGQALVRADPKKAAAKPKKDDAAAKKGGKVQDLNKDMPLKAQEQGFTGKKVQHDDGKTGTSDWQKEYGHSDAFLQAARGEPSKKTPADTKKASKKEDLGKAMPLEAQEQGFSGEKVQHADGKTKTDDWRDEYGHDVATPRPPAPKKSGSIRGSAPFAVLVLTISAGLFAQ